MASHSTIRFNPIRLFNVGTLRAALLDPDFPTSNAARRVPTLPTTVGADSRVCPLKPYLVLFFVTISFPKKRADTGVCPYRWRVAQQKECTLLHTLVAYFSLFTFRFSLRASRGRLPYRVRND